MNTIALSESAAARIARLNGEAVTTIGDCGNKLPSSTIDAGVSIEEILSTFIKQAVALADANASTAKRARDVTKQLCKNGNTTGACHKIEKAERNVPLARRVALK